MTLTELQNIINDYQDALYSPDLMHVHFGCDCGCGGDSYTEESWDLAIKRSEESIQKMKDFCITHNVTYDGLMMDL